MALIGDCRELGVARDFVPLPGKARKATMACQRKGTPQRLQSARMIVSITLRRREMRTKGMESNRELASRVVLVTGSASDVPRGKDLR